MVVDGSDPFTNKIGLSGEEGEGWKGKSVWYGFEIQVDPQPHSSHYVFSHDQLGQRRTAG